jgi:hypothetical protein
LAWPTSSARTSKTTTAPRRDAPSRDDEILTGLKLPYRSDANESAIT